MESGGQMIVGGLLLLVVAFVLRRSFTQSKVSRNRDPQKEAHAEIHAAESSYAAAINKMELRVTDYAREVEGRIGTKIAVLNRLLAEAETSIKRLEELAQQRPAGGELAVEGSVAVESQESRDGRRVIYDLADTGLSVDEIAERISEPATHVRLILKMRDGSENRDAG